jgi:hypothetical protein
LQKALFINYNHSPQKMITKQYPLFSSTEKNKAATSEDYSLKTFHGGDAVPQASGAMPYQ